MRRRDKDLRLYGALSDLVPLVTRSVPTTPALIQAYNQKYDWDYRVSEYGELTQVQPSKVLAWRTAGGAGRDSFQTTGSWIFNDLG